MDDYGGGGGGGKKDGEGAGGVGISHSLDEAALLEAEREIIDRITAKVHTACVKYDLILDIFTDLTMASCVMVMKQPLIT